MGWVEGGLMRKYMYTDEFGSSIFIVTDKEFLSQPCNEAEVSLTTDKIVSQIIETARRLNGCREGLSCLGLAANQLGYNTRIMVLRINNKYKPFINPVILESYGSQEFSETCYSRPGKPPIKTERSVSIKVSARNIKSKMLYGLSAISFQHEMDHLDGVLI